MEPDQTFDDVRDWIEETQQTMPQLQWVETALAAAEQLPVGGPGRAELLAVAGEVLTAQGEEDRALTHLHAAVEDGGWTTIDPRTEVVHALLTFGRASDADAYLSAARRQVGEVRSEAGLPASMGEVLEMADRHQEAERWYTIGLRDFDPEIDDADLDEETCLWGRFRVRRRRGLGLDRFDTWVVTEDPESIGGPPST